MPSISQPLLGAGAQAKNEWGKAEAATALTFTGEAEFRRGIEVAIGLSALASADAGLSRFVDASARGNAFAEATASLHCQLPLNLFDDFGLRIGAQAVAQAAAGIEVGLGISVGDFIALVRQNGESLGIPADLVVLLLDEASVGGKFEVHIAAAAMAYASVQITGEVVKDPGFHVTADAGLGLAAGVGFSGSLDLGIRDFRRFYGRAVDLAINSVVDGVGALLPNDLKPLVSQAQALAPAATAALRVAYEVGDYLAKNQPGPDHQSALDLSNHCVGVILEEAQRFLFGRFLEAGLRSLEHLVANDLAALGPGEWDSLLPRRQALAAVLYRMPAEPFQPTDDNTAYWPDLIERAIDLIDDLPPQAGDDVTRGMAIVFSTVQLLTEAIKSRINLSQSYAFAIGAGRVAEASPPFSGLLDRQPASKIKRHIDGALGRGASRNLDYEDLIAYLTKEVVITTLREALPAVDEYLSIFQHPEVAEDLADVLRALLHNREAFIPDQSGDRDPQETLRVLLGVIDAFLTDKIEQNLVPAVNKQLAGGNVVLYFNEVLMGTLIYTKNVAFQTVLGWETHPVDRSAFTEALAGVMTMLLGRSLVLVGDSFMATLQADMERACAYAAGEIEVAHDPFVAMGISPSPELKELLAETLRIGGEVFGPLPEQARRSLRLVLYDVMETLPPSVAEQSGFLEQLADQFFIPNQDSVNRLSNQLLTISRDRFQLFVEKVLESGVKLISDAIEGMIGHVIEAVIKWEKDLDNTISVLINAIGKLGTLIQQVTGQAQQAFSDAAQKLDALLEAFSDARLRSRLRQDIANTLFIDAKSVLATLPFFPNLPRAVQQFVEGILENVVADLIEGPILNPIFDAIGAIAGELDSVLGDVKELNPNIPLAPQLLDLLVDRMEDNIRNSFGGSTPCINVGFTATVFGLRQPFSLGTIVLPFDKLFRILRDAIAALNFYESELNAAAVALRAAFEKSLDLQAKQNSRDNKQADRDRLRLIRDEFTSDPKTITVVSPVQSLIYDGDVDVDVRLGGVPLSYFGLENDEQQRVLILINGALIPPQALVLYYSPVNQNANALVDQSNGGGRTGVAKGMKGSATQSAQSLSMKSGARGVLPPNLNLPLQPALRSLAATRGESPSAPIMRQLVKQSGKGAALVTSVLTNVLPGRRMTATKRAKLEQTLPPGTTVKFHADRGKLFKGTNTLVAVVIDPGGQRYQQVVSFGVEAAPPRRRNVGSRLPAVSVETRDGKPALSPTGFDLHFSHKLIADRLKKGQKFLTGESNRHFQDFRQRQNRKGTTT